MLADADRAETYRLPNQPGRVQLHQISWHPKNRGGQGVMPMHMHEVAYDVTSGTRAMSHHAGFKRYVPMSYRKAKFSKSWIRRWRREFGVSEPKQIHARKVPWAKLADRMRRLWWNAVVWRSVWHRCFAPCMATYGQPYVWIDQKPCHFTPKGKAKKLLPVAHGATHDENPVTLRL